MVRCRCVGDDELKRSDQTGRGHLTDPSLRAAAQRVTGLGKNRSQPRRISTACSPQGSKVGQRGAQQMGLAVWVLVICPGPSRSITSCRPRTAERGIPPEMPLPQVINWGEPRGVGTRTSFRSGRNAAWISSKIRSASWCDTSAAAAGRSRPETSGRCIDTIGKSEPIPIVWREP